ncbi:MAG: MmgE/PrpD family protein [Solirubrobacteraceae bacterium]
MTGAERLAEFATALSLDDIPEDVVEDAKLHLLDVLGCGLAAEGYGLGTEGRVTMAELGGEPQASVIGHREGMPAANAAFANAVACHALDFDDTHAGCTCHISVVVCPAAVAAAEACGASGPELLTAIVAGNEIVARIGMAAPSAFHERGLHPTAVVGIFGATAAVCRLRGLDAPRTTRALGIAGSMGSGLFAYLSDGSATKPIHAGWAAHGAVLAAALAAHGATGPAAVLEDRFGTYAVHAGSEDVDLEPQLADLGERWETSNIAYKPYPACHFIHASLGAVASIVEREALAPGDIAEIVAVVPHPNYVQTVLEPVEDKVAPRTSYEAKFSLQYSAAAMVVHGRVGLESYEEAAIRDREVLDVAQRVTHELAHFATYPQALPGGARVRTTDGRELVELVPYQLGCAENPMSADDVRAKFRGNASRALGDDAVGALEGAVLGLDDLPGVEGAFAVLGEASARQPAAA